MTKRVDLRIANWPAPPGAARLLRFLITDYCSLITAIQHPRHCAAALAVVG